MMKRILCIAAFVAVFAGCNRNGEEQKQKIDVAGIWELSSVATKASIGSVQVDVYLDFAAGTQFTLYQKIGEGRYTKFTGTYNLEAGQLSGKYASGSAWGPYTAVRDGNNLTLTTPGGKEVDTYKKIEAIPASVTENIY